MLVTDDPPPPNRSRRKLETQIHISQSARRYSKPGDRQLISWIAEHDSGIVSQPRANSALFYPSAGEDIVTPTIIGLPHCRNFYYYELLIRALPASFIKGLEESLGTEIETQKTEYEDLYLFDIDGIRRTIHWVHRDNKEFLQKNKLLTFYFHRGEGEGGAWQPWDCDLLPELLKMAGDATNCRILTDGVPGGLHPELNQVLEEVPFGPKSGSQHRRPYYFGVLNRLMLQRLNLDLSKEEIAQTKY